MLAMVTTRPVTMLLFLVIMLAMDTTHAQFNGKHLRTYGFGVDKPWSRQIRGGKNSFFR